MRTKASFLLRAEIDKVDADSVGAVIDSIARAIERSEIII